VLDDEEYAKDKEGQRIANDRRARKEIEQKRHLWSERGAYGFAWC
jgi:hypothetical protein